MCLFFFFFFQAEDGIRDYKVTGVQTCALPICLWEYRGLVRPQKTPSGHRRYTAEDVGRIRDIRRLRSVQGLNLAAIQGVLGVNGTAPIQRASHGADRKSTRLNSSHLVISYAVFCLKEKKQ